PGGGGGRRRGLRPAPPPLTYQGEQRCSPGSGMRQALAVARAAGRSAARRWREEWPVAGEGGAGWRRALCGVLRVREAGPPDGAGGAAVGAEEEQRRGVADVRVPVEQAGDVALLHESEDGGLEGALG